MAGGDDRAWMPPASGTPTETLAGYVDLVEVARGGDSIVYRARQLRPERDVAVKVLLVDEEQALRRFERELEITVRLGREHPNIVTVLDTGTAGSGRPCLVMDFVEQGSLADRLSENGPLTVSEVVSVGTTLADALAFAHGRGVLHRDVKPQNVLLLPTSYVLTDFGVARLADSENTASADRFSYRHASPQMLDGQPATAADDLWSVGSTLFTLLDGRPPFATDEPGDDTALAYLRRARTESPRALVRDDVPDGLREAIARCLVKEPGERWPSAAALRDALAAVPTEARAWDPDRRPGQQAEPQPEPPVEPQVEPRVEPQVEPRAGSAWAPVADPLAAREVAPETPTETPPQAPSAGADEPSRAAAVEPAAPAASALAHESPAVAPSEDATGVAPGRTEVPVVPEHAAAEGQRRQVRRRIGLFVGLALLLGVGLGGVGYVLSTRDDPSARGTPSDPDPSRGPIVPVESASSVPSPTGPVLTDPRLAPRIDDLRSSGTGIYLHWTDPSGGKATFLVVRADPAGNYWTGRLQGAGTSGTLTAYGPKSPRPCFVVVAITGDNRAVSPKRCLTVSS